MALATRTLGPVTALPGGGGDPEAAPSPAWHEDTGWAEDTGTLRRTALAFPEDADGPGYAYIPGLLARDTTTVLPTALIDYHFSETRHALSPAFKALITIVVTQGVGGFGGALGLSSQWAISAANAFAANAIVGVIDAAVTGDMDIANILEGATFASLSAGLTAGINLGSLAGASGDSLLGIPATGTGQAALLSPAVLLDGMGDAALRAGLSSAVYDTDFGDALRVGLSSFALSQATSALQFGVGEIKAAQGLPEGSAGGALLHGLVGCVSHAAAGANCAAGFAGGVATELSTGLLGRGFTPDPNATVPENEAARRAYEQNTAELIGALAGYAFSGGNPDTVSHAAATARTATAYNRQLHLNELRILADLLGLPEEAVSEDIFERIDEFSEEDRHTLAAACALIHCADHLSFDDPAYAQRRALQEQGVGLIQAEDASFRALQTATIAYFQENNLSREINGATITSLHERNAGMSGQAQGGFLYTGFDARHDIMRATGVDVFGQARAQSGPASLLPDAAVGALETFSQVIDCSTRLEACRGLWDDAIEAITGTVQAVRALPDYPQLLENTDLAVARFIDGTLTREEFVTVLTDAGARAGTAEAVIVALGMATTPGTTLLRDRTPDAANKGLPSAGAVNFMDDVDGFFLNARNRPDVDPNGYFDVVAHGNSNQIQIKTPNGNVLVDHRTAARLIQQQPGYNGQSIRLLSCSTGQCDTGFAQNLANKLNVTVEAPSDILWAYPNGKMVIAPRGTNGLPDLSNQGQFNTFVPGGNVAD
ncbi:MAG: DUF637 domain-containing protein [Pseudomonadota bacterium]